MHSLVSCAALAAIAGLTSSIAKADTFTFSNNCGTGNWGTTCAAGGGNFSSNWGRTGPSPALLLPGAADTAVINGSVLMDISATVVHTTVNAGSTLTWQSAAYAGAFTNNGAVAATTGFNKFLTGAAVNNAGASWSISDGAFYLSPGSLTSNAGATLTLGANGSVRRNGGAVADNTLDNRGILDVTGGNALISGVTVRSQASGVWRIAPLASLTFDSVSFGGDFHGDHDGTTSIVSGCTLSADTRFSTDPGSNPWRWTSAYIDTGPFALTNAGLFLFDTGFNKFLTGTMISTSSGSMDFAEGAFYLSPVTGTTMLGSAGTVTIGNASLRRNGGAIESAVFTSSGTVRGTSTGSLISGLTVESQNGVWATDTGAALLIDNCRMMGAFNGQHSGVGELRNATIVMGDASLTTAPGTRAWEMNSIALDTGSFVLSNFGAVRSTTGFNKFLTGRVDNLPGSEWSFEQGTFYLTPVGAATTSFINSGTVRFPNNGTINRSGGSLAAARFVNNGVVHAAGVGGAIRQVSIEGGGTWQTEAGATLTIEGVAIGGTLVGQHAGDGNLSGACPLTSNTTLATGPGSRAWRWIGPAFDANTFTLTNTGKIDSVTGFNKFITGAMVNTATGELNCLEGTLHLSPGGVAGNASLVTTER